MHRTACSLLVVAAFAGCGGGGDDGGIFGGGEQRTTTATTAGPTATAGGPTGAQAPVPAVPPPGAPSFTKNTTRVPGADAAELSATVARAAFPARTAETRPRAVVLVPAGDWRAGVAAAQLTAGPTRVPVLIGPSGAGTELPKPTADALTALNPTGDGPGLNGAQVIRLSATSADIGPRKARDIPATTPFEQARALDELARRLRGGDPGDRVLVTGVDSPEVAMLAAGWAAKSGDPVLYARRDEVPPETRAAIRAHGRPRIYVLGGEEVVGQKAVQVLQTLGDVTRIAGDDAVDTSIDFARFSDGDMGWGIVDPGHGFVFARTDRPMDAVAAAPLSGSGTYGPLLLLQDAASLPTPLREYLLDVQPGYEDDPTRGVYNHGWIVGGEDVVSLDTQAAIDDLLEIRPVQASE